MLLILTMAVSTLSPAEATPGFPLIIGPTSVADPYGTAFECWSDYLGYPVCFYQSFTLFADGTVADFYGTVGAWTYDPREGPMGGVRFVWDPVAWPYTYEALLTGTCVGGTRTNSAITSNGGPHLGDYWGGCL